MKNSQQEYYSFADHLTELRSRIIVCFVTLGFGTVAGYVFSDRIVSFLLRPVNQPLYYSSPAGGFDFTLKISLFVGCLITIPILIYEVVQFIAPAFSERVRKLLPVIIISSFFLVVCGILFAYFVSLPAALFFLNKFSNEQVHSLLSTSEYLSFMVHYILGFGVVFQLPLLLVVINSVKKIPLKVLMKYQKWVLLGSFIIAAVLTPTPDVFNQLIMAVPLLLLYEASVVTIYIINRHR